MTAPVYPRTEPHVAGMLTLSDGAELAWECSGNPTGIPAVHLHGGPGGGRGRRGFGRRSRGIHFGRGQVVASGGGAAIGGRSAASRSAAAPG